jgi:hypothetical protein
MSKIFHSETNERRRTYYLDCSPQEEIKTCCCSQLNEIIKATKDTHPYLHELALKEWEIRESLRVDRIANECFLDHLIEP